MVDLSFYLSSWSPQDLVNEIGVKGTLFQGLFGQFRSLGEDCQAGRVWAPEGCFQFFEAVITHHLSISNCPQLLQSFLEKALLKTSE